MRTTSPLAALVAVCALGVPSPATAGAQPKTMVRLPPGPRPTAMAVELTVDPAARTFSGRVEISLSVPEPTGSVAVNGKELTVTAAEVVAAGATIPAKARAAPADQQLVFALARPVPAGEAVLRVSYTGPLSDRGEAGLYVQRDGKEPIAFTQLENTDARRVFPCFDEPSYKIPWQITLRVPRGLDAITGTPEVARVDDGAFQKITFARTRPLPSYLLAVVVGKLGRVALRPTGRRKIPHAIVTPRGREREARFVASVHAELVEKLEEYFDVPFPYDKLDNVGRPDGRGAMENAGIIISGGAILLADPDRESASFRRATASTAAHEIAHQWFGDLVTMAWWDDVWLNEAFANWIETRTYAIRPGWSSDAERADMRTSALLADLLSSARKIRQPIESLDDIDNAFDDITYDKGASVLRMFEVYVGEDRFRAGVHAYLEKHADGNATTADFTAAVGQGEELHTFVDQPGFPEVAVETHCDGKPRIVLGQRRYVPVGADAGSQKWRVPVCVNGRCTLVTAPSAEIPLSACPELVLANSGAGYYIATYDDRAWAAIVAAGARLALAEQLSVVTDARVGLTAGRLAPERAFALLEAWAPWASPDLADALVELARTFPERQLVGDEARPRFAGWVTRVFGPRARALGWQAHAGEDDAVRILRPHLLALVALHGDDPKLAAEARAAAAGWLSNRRSVDPDALEGILEVAAWTGDAAFADRLLAARSAGDAVDRHLVGKNLLAFAGEGAFARAAGALLHTIQPRDFPSFRSASPDNPAARRLFRFVVDHYDALAARLPPDNRQGLLFAGRGLCSAADARAYESFFASRAAGIEGGPRTFAQALERIQICAAAKDALAGGVTAYLSR